MIEFNVKVPILEIEEAAYNPRVASEEALKGLGASLEAYGLLIPLVVNKRNGRLIGGHQRLRILKERGETEVLVTSVDLGEEDEIALNLILNSERARGRFVSEKLVPLLQELSLNDTFFATRLNVLLEEFRVDFLDDDFQPDKREEEKEKGEGFELEQQREDDSVDIEEDDVNYLRLHFTREDAEELENLFAGYMKKHSIASMTESVLKMLEGV